MKVANIVPTPLLSYDSDFMMGLWQVAQDNRIYAAFLRNRPQGTFLLFDNGAAEGENPSPEELYPVYALVDPDQIVLPDVIGNKDETLRQTVAAIQYFADKDLKCTMMAVPQGETFADWCECAERMLQMPEVVTLGISKFVSKLYAEEMGKGTNVRLECAAALYDLCTMAGRLDVNVHLLGCWENAKEIGEINQAYLGTDFIRSTDSALAYVYTRAGKVLAPTTPRPDNDEIDFHNGDLEDKELLRVNIELWMNACQG